MLPVQHSQQDSLALDQSDGLGVLSGYPPFSLQIRRTAHTSAFFQVRSTGEVDEEVMICDD